jgi:hypothetical protein
MLHWIIVSKTLAMPMILVMLARTATILMKMIMVLKISTTH